MANPYDIGDVEASVDLAPCCTANGQAGAACTYTLQACIVHRHHCQASRQATSGHHLTHFKEDGCWYTANDTLTTLCEEIHLGTLSTLPYIIFLQKSTTDSGHLRPATVNSGAAVNWIVPFQNKLHIWSWMRCQGWNWMTDLVAISRKQSKQLSLAIFWKTCRRSNKVSYIAAVACALQHWAIVV